VAVGQYTDSSGQYKGLLVSGSGSNWTAVPVPLPHGAAPSRDGVYLDSVACLSPGTCVAVGEYIDSSGSRQGLLLTGSGSNWTAVKAPLPAGAALNPQVAFFRSSVACPTAKTCVVAGSYEDSAGDWQGVLLTGSGSTWSTVKAPLPADALAGPEVDLSSVACSSATACVVAGRYPCNDTNNCEAGLLLAGLGTTWTTVKAPLPANAQPGTALGVLGCAPGGNCLAAGSYADSSGNAQGLLESGSGSNWAPTEAPLPPDAVADPYAYFSSVACPSVGTCVVTGGYNAAGGGGGLLLTSSGSNWTAAEAPVPANARSNSGGGLNSVACATATSCLAVGLYGTISDQAQGLLEEGSGSTWAPSEARLPAGGAKGDRAGSDLESVACPSPGTCVAVGQYTDSSDHGQGLLLTRSGSNWTAVKAPLSPDRYIALGDSYSSGEGDGNYLAGTNTTIDQCHRSAHAYPELLDKGQKLGRLGFVSCSGAITDDFFNTNNETNNEPAQSQALSPETKYVSLTFGGNDLGFRDVLIQCIYGKDGPVVVKAANCAKDTSLQAAVAQRLQALAGTASADTPTGVPIHSIASILQSVHQLAPNAKIYVADYPLLFGTNFSSDCGVGTVLAQHVPILGNVKVALKLNQAEITWLNSVGTSLANVIKTAAAANGATFVDASPNFDSHRFCDVSNAWFNYVSGTYNDSTGHLNVSSGSFHPTPDGQQSGYEAAFSTGGL
jgi:lysophospholipase L1-like esterase